MSRQPSPRPPALPAPAALDTSEQQRLRECLPTVLGRAYLNAGTLGPMPHSAVEAHIGQIRSEGRDRQPKHLWEDLADQQQQVRMRVARLVDADVAQVALMHATHEGVNASLWGLDLREGDNIVTTDEEHPGLLVPLRIARERRGVELRMASFANESQPFVEGVLQHVNARTRAVVLSHVSWISGNVAPLRMLRAALPNGVMLIVDGAQGAGALPVSQRLDGWDAYTVSGQKWPLGPNGTGALVLADPQRWAPTYGAYFTTQDPHHPLDAPFQRDGRRFEVAQESVAPLAAFAASLDFLLDEVRVERAASHSSWLNAEARSLMHEAGVAGDGNLAGALHLLALRVPEGRAPELVAGLLERGIVVRDLTPGMLRLSLGFWNTRDELAATATALRELLARD